MLKLTNEQKKLLQTINNFILDRLSSLHPDSDSIIANSIMEGYEEELEELDLNNIIEDYIYDTISNFKRG